MNEMTEQQALLKLTDICSKSEHCSGEMLDKMRRWNIAEDAQARIMEYLVGKKFIDDERFCRFFIKDKIRYNKWGRRKVEQALWAKHITQDIYSAILDEVPTHDYIEILKPLIKSKSRTVKAGSDYERKMKLIKFALGRGFTMDVISQCIDGADEEYQDD